MKTDRPIDWPGFIKRFNDLRARKGLTITDVVQRTGIDSRAAQGLCAGIDVHNMLSMHHVVKLCRLVGASLDYMFYGPRAKEPTHVSEHVGTIICRRETRTCQAHRRRATKLCDFKLSGARQGQTCDAPLCDACAVSQGKGIDYCPPHARFVHRNESQPRTRQEETR
jgi:hypothetical protein